MIRHLRRQTSWILALVAVAGGATGAMAQPSAEILGDAARALDAGEHQRAADLARGALAADRLPAVDRAEAWRIFGLASFFLDQHARAENAFLEYLKLEVDGRLDPALVPPEAIVFFEDVRARHAATLRRYRPPPEQRRYWALNLLPPAGQLQNGHRITAWTVAGLGSLLLATNIASFWTLRRWCDTSTGVCKSGDESRTEAARALRTVNLTSGAVLLGVIAYGIYDGFHHYRVAPQPGTASLHLHPTPGGGFISLSRRF